MKNQLNNINSYSFWFVSETEQGWTPEFEGNDPREAYDKAFEKYGTPVTGMIFKKSNTKELRELLISNIFENLSGIQRLLLIFEILHRLPKKQKIIIIEKLTIELETHNS